MIYDVVSTLLNRYSLRSNSYDFNATTATRRLVACSSTSEGFGKTDNPYSGWTAKAVVIQVVMVSGAILGSTRCPSGL